MNKNKIIIISMGIIIVILIGALFIPKVIASVKDKFQVEGYNICMLNVVDIMITDLQQQGFTELRLGNQTIKLGIIPQNQSG